MCPTVLFVSEISSYSTFASGSFGFDFNFLNVCYFVSKAVAVFSILIISCVLRLPLCVRAMVFVETFLFDLTDLIDPLVDFMS